MRAQRAGTIVNLSSLVGKLTFPLGGVYSASKYAVEAISDSLRLELRPFGIRVVTIRPGPVASEFNEVSNQISGDFMGALDPDYQPLLQAVGPAVGGLFQDLDIPGPEVVAEVILGAVLTQNPRASYAVGPFTQDFLARRLADDDDAWDAFWSEKMGLRGLKL